MPQDDASKKVIVLTDDFYMMSDVFPHEYSTMKELPCEIDTSKVTNMYCMFVPLSATDATPDIFND